MDMAMEALKNGEIPCFKQMETASGLKISMQPDFPWQGPGTWWAVYVAEPALEEAKAILSGIPFRIGTQPDYWHFTSSPTIKKWIKVFITLWLISQIIALIFGICSEFLGHSR
jgi:hypothetical protein